jgi:hypothetical protein
MTVTHLMKNTVVHTHPLKFAGRGSAAPDLEPKKPAVRTAREAGSPSWRCLERWENEGGAWLPKTSDCKSL